MKFHNHNKKTKKNRTIKNIQSLNKYECDESPLKKFEEDYEKKFEYGLIKENTNIQKKLIKLFNTSFSPKEITSKNDYYTYINYQWLEEKQKEIREKDKYYVQVDAFRMTQEKVYYELIDIVKDYIKNNNNKKATLIKNVYESLYNLDNKEAENYVKYVNDRMNDIVYSNNLYRLLAEITQNEIISWGCPLVWNVLPDEKNSKYYRSYISAPQLTIYDYTIYIEDEEEDQENMKYKKLFKKRYLQYIKEIFDACLGKNNNINPHDIWDCEYEILDSLGSNDIKNDEENGYNLVKRSEALKKCNLDWDEFATQIGYKEVPEYCIVSSLNYVNSITKKLQKDDTWKSKKWISYYKYIIFRQLIRFHSEWKNIHYEFQEKFIKGQPAPYPKEIYPIFGLSLTFNEFLSNEYYRKYKNEKAINYVKNMGNDLLLVYQRIIKRNNWLTPLTKKYALKKLENIKLTVGKPDITSKDILLNYKSKGGYQNLKKMAVYRYKKYISLDGKTSDETFPMIDWNEFKLVGKQPYIVNAFYTPTENSIYIPLAILQKPFIDLDERGIEYNLAHIGYTLGHEMSHCLDDLGSKFDFKGNLYNWWTPNDRRKFNLKVKDVIKQYELFASYDGIKMDASLSTGENLADISGVGICIEYLRDFQDKNEDVIPIRALSFHAFFIYFAIQARQQIYEEAIKAQLKVNPHPMDKYRTNCPLARLELFKSLYNIEKKDKMYWSKNDTIW